MGLAAQGPLFENGSDHDFFAAVTPINFSEEAEPLRGLRMRTSQSLRANTSSFYESPCRDESNMHYCGRQPWLRAWRSAASVSGSPTIRFSITVRTDAGKPADAWRGPVPSPDSMAAIAAIRQAPRSRQAIPASALS